MDTAKSEVIKEKRPKKVVIMKKDHKPIIVKSKSLVQTWWGKAWNVNLERYADYTNRIDRGRSYVRHGAVVDLRIGNGVVKALVQGRTAKPYTVSIWVEDLREDLWNNIVKSCEGKLESMSQLLEGEFPQDLAEIFTNPGSGMFPSLDEITFSCGCPDWASMCKHVAAALYGVGVRIDEDPGKFFKLRKVNISDLVSRAVEDRTKNLLEKAGTNRSRVIDHSKIQNVFDIDMEDDVDLGKIFESKYEIEDDRGEAMSYENDQDNGNPRDNETFSEIQNVRHPNNKRRKKKKFNFDAFMHYFMQSYDIPTRENIEKLHVKLDRIERLLTAESPVQSVQPRKQKRQTKSAIDTVMDVIADSSEGMTVADIEEKTGFDVIKVRNVIFRLHKMDKIKRMARGVYVAA